jgi:branched-chain amino acid transport system substrate-binding protein
MRKWFYVLLAMVILAAAIPLAGCAGDKESYKVGAIFAETGVNSSLGTPEKQTVDMMVKKINAKGGINGHKLEVIAYDTKSLSDECVILTNRLIEQDQVLAIIGPSSTGESKAIKQIVDTAEIPLISCAAGAAIVTDAPNKWVFKTPQSDVLAVRALYKYIRDVKAFTKIAILTDTGGFGQGGKAFLESEAASYGITIVAKETFDPTGTDMTAQLTNIKNTTAQAFVCWTTSQGAAIVAKNRTDINMTMPLFCSHGVANMTFINNAVGSANGVIFPAGKLLVADQLDESDPQKAVLLKYETDFEAEYSGKTADTFGGHAYDALNLVVEALEKVGPDKAKIRDYIENNITNWPGTGGMFNMSPDDHNGLTEGCFIMVEIKNGEWSWLKPL